MKVIYKKEINREELIKTLEDLISQKKDLDEQFEGIEEYFGSIADSSVHNAAYMTFDRYCDMFCLAFGIDSEDLSWFIYENQMGDFEMEYEINGKLLVVDSAESFVDCLIKKSESKSKF